MTVIPTSRYTVTLDVRGRSVVTVEAATGEEACREAEKHDPWDLEVEVYGTTAEAWELDES